MASSDNTTSKPTGQGADASGNRPASTSTSSTSGERFSSSRHAGGAVTDDVKEIANDLTDKAGRVAGQAQQTASELGGQFAGAATRLADSQVKAGANLIQNVSKAATAAARELHAVQQAWIDEQVPQCGYCQNGMMIKATELLNKVKRPTEAHIKSHMNGHLCRCGTYTRITRAIQRAGKAMA